MTLAATAEPKPKRKRRPKLPEPDSAAFVKRALQRELTPVVIYVDGSCPLTDRSPDKGFMGAGIVAYAGNVTREWGVPLGGGGINQQAELLAIQHALRHLNRRAVTAVLIYSDSEYAIGVLTQPWTLRCNQEIIAATGRLAQACAIFEMQHLEGHRGIPSNERAHDLGVAARKSQQTYYAHYVDGVVQRSTDLDRAAAVLAQVREDRQSVIASGREFIAAAAQAETALSLLQEPLDCPDLGTKPLPPVSDPAALAAITRLKALLGSTLIAAAEIVAALDTTHLDTTALAVAAPAVEG